MRASPTALALLQPHELAALDRLGAEAAIRTRVQNAFLGNNVALTRILGRYKFFVDTRDEGFGSHVLLDGYWEIWLTLFLARNLRRGMVVADVGANFGYYSLMCAEFVGPAGKVVAVEPNPAAADLLQRTISLNGFRDRTSVERVALDSESGGRVLLYVPHSEPKNALVVASHEVVDQSAGHMVGVASMTMDDLLADYPAVDLIKIDAEGSEERIYAGMQAIVERHRPMIVMEFNAARYADAGGFLDRMSKSYGLLYHVDFDGRAAPIGRRELLETRRGEDWLLVLSRHAPD